MFAFFILENILSELNYKIKFIFEKNFLFAVLFNFWIDDKRFTNFNWNQLRVQFTARCDGLNSIHANELRCNFVIKNIKDIKAS